MSIKQQLFIILIICTPALQAKFWSSPAKTGASFTLMLDPAGDAQHTGRILSGKNKSDEMFERGVTLMFAERLKQELEQYCKDVRIVLTRFPGETLEPLQNANFANRLDVQCYISINFYQEPEHEQSKIYLYHFVYNPVTDFWKKTFDEIMFLPYDQAHLINIGKTREWAMLMQSVLNNGNFSKKFNFKGIFGIPFKPLIGIKAPALALEIGLTNKDDWMTFLEPIAHSLHPIIDRRSS